MAKEPVKKKSTVFVDGQSLYRAAKDAFGYVYPNYDIKKLSEKKEGLVFILWGAFAQAKEKLIDLSKHHVLKAAHPSPFSAYNGFFGCKHFSKTNELLREMGKEEIDWDLNNKNQLFINN